MDVAAEGVPMSDMVAGSFLRVFVQRDSEIARVLSMFSQSVSQSAQMREERAPACLLVDDFVDHPR